jgi:CheY-like chemotaxis protein
MGDDLRKIRDLSERAVSLTRQLLAFSRQQSLQPQVLDLNGLLTRSSAMLERLLGEDIELVFEPDTADPGLIRADPAQIEQVLMNLTANARDAMPAGGTLTLELAIVDLVTGQAARQAGVQPGSYATLTVKDSGHGMDVETMAHIFEPFFTTKDVGKGTGLGLPMVYGIIAQHGGNVLVFSEPDQGTTFRIYLPLVEEHGEESLSATREDPLASGAETILVVEDEERVLDDVQRLLLEQGYEVLTATNPVDAEALFAEVGDEVSLLVTDLAVPGSGGRHLYAKLRQSNPELKVLHLSGSPERAESGSEGPDTGDEDLRNPLGPEELARALREMLDA